MKLMTTPNSFLLPYVGSKAGHQRIVVRLDELIEDLKTEHRKHTYQYQKNVRLNKKFETNLHLGEKNAIWDYIKKLKKMKEAN